MSSQTLIILTRLDGVAVYVVSGAISMVEPPMPGEHAGAQSKVMVAGQYRWFTETVAVVLHKLNGVT